MVLSRAHMHGCLLAWAKNWGPSYLLLIAASCGPSENTVPIPRTDWLRALGYFSRPELGVGGKM